MTQKMRRQLHLQDDHMSGNWSLGSNYHPCSQSRKISIGLVVDSVAKMEGNKGKEAVAGSQNLSSAKDIPAESKHKGKETISSDVGRQNKAPSPVLDPKQVSSLPSTNNVPLQPSGNKKVGDGSVFATQMNNLHVKDANEEKSNKNTYQTAEKGTTGERGNITLRMKVQELLGTVYSPNKSPETFGTDANKSKPNKNDIPVAMHRQPLHANSGSLDHTMRRPVTRSSTGNQPQKQKSEAQFCRNKQAADLDEKDFCFVETWSRRPSTDTSSKRKERDITGTRPVKKCFVEGDSRKRTSTAVNVSLFENRNTEPKEKTHQKFEVNMGRRGATLFNKMDQDPFPLTNNHVDDNLKSPTFELKTGNLSPSERSLKTKGTQGHSNATTKNSQDSPIIKSATLMKESRCSRSSSKEVESEDGSPPVSVPVINENRWTMSPCQEEEVSESSEDGSPIKGEGDSEELIEENGVAGAVKLFALALERVETKIRSSTSRQSAEILLSVSKNIHSHLQNTESKIQNQVGKLTELGKSRRMRPEKQWQEQQEQLKRIYEKFKQQVDEHLDKCRTTLQGLETNEVEIRGMVEKQRVSHRKLLLQTEEAIEAQLNEAQTRLADVQRVAKEKMLKLKYGIAECLKHS